MADNNISLINTDGLAKFGIALLDKLSNAIGWIADRETPEKIAIQEYIDDIKRSNYDPLIKAAMISNAKKTIAEYSNQRDIVHIAIQNINKDSQPDKIENDWLSQFMNKARLVSDSDFQQIWGRILAEECNAPGSIPRSLLHTLDRMDKKDAERFTMLCSFSVLTKDNNEYSFIPIIIEHYLKEYYTPKGVSFDALIDLKSLGLIDVSLGPFAHGYCTILTSTPNEVLYFDKRFIIPDFLKELPVGGVLFTKTGQALRRAIEPEEQEEFFNQYCIPFWEKRIADAKKTMATVNE